MIDGDFVFGSEIKSFLKYPKFKKEVNEKALKHYLVFQYNPLEETFFKGVKKLRPGHYYIFENGKLEIKSYYNLTLDYKEMTFDEAVSKIEKKLKNQLSITRLVMLKLDLSCQVVLTQVMLLRQQCLIRLFL